MAVVNDTYVEIRADASRFHAAIDSMYEPINWRHRLVAWVANRLGVRADVKRSLRGFPGKARLI